MLAGELIVWEDYTYDIPVERVGLSLESRLLDKFITVYSDEEILYVAKEDVIHEDR